MTIWTHPEPNGLTYVVGDIHGRADQLSRLLDLIEADATATGAGKVSLVFVGDYVDRGEQSAEVLRILSGLEGEAGVDVTCLAGNHEEMLLAFLEDPLGRPKRWLRHGGVQTLASFGVAPPSSLEAPTSAELLDAAGDLREALGPALIGWLESLFGSWVSGNLWAVHAGADPALPMDQQDPTTLLWGHDDFFDVDRSDGQWVVVGHRPVEAPFADRGRIAIDTGAVFGGPLTALRSLPGEAIRFLQS